MVYNDKWIMRRVKRVIPIMGQDQFANYWPETFKSEKNRLVEVF